MLPGCDLDSVARLSTEIVLQVVDDDRLAQVSADFAQIFNVEDASIYVYPIGVMPVESVRDQLTISVEVVQDLISVVLFACGED